MSARDKRALAAAASTIIGAGAAYMHVRKAAFYAQDIFVLNMYELSKKYQWPIPEGCKPPVEFSANPDACVPPMSYLALYMAGIAFFLAVVLSLRIWAKPKQ
jgi:hypothetical protein